MGSGGKEEQAELKCPECGGGMVLRDSKFGKFYGCSNFPSCKSAHGAHADGRPLGVPADKETKQWRIRAHDAFDTLWKGGRMKRGEAYRLMQAEMGMTADEAHIGMFGIEQCERVVEWARRLTEARQGGSQEQSPGRRK